MKSHWLFIPSKMTTYHTHCYTSQGHCEWVSQRFEEEEKKPCYKKSYTTYESKSSRFRHSYIHRRLPCMVMYPRTNAQLWKIRKFEQRRSNRVHCLFGVPREAMRVVVAVTSCVEKGFFPDLNIIIIETEQNGIRDYFFFFRENHRNFKQ